MLAGDMRCTSSFSSLRRYRVALRPPAAQTANPELRFIRFLHEKQGPMANSDAYSHHRSRSRTPGGAPLLGAILPGGQGVSQGPDPPKEVFPKGKGLPPNRCCQRRWKGNPVTEAPRWASLVPSRPNGGAIPRG